jgi:CBS domain-containing protein
MTPRALSDSIISDPGVLRTSDTLEQGVRLLLDHELPALVVLDERGRYAGVFGEREFMSALFPGYLDQLKGAGFLSRSLDVALERRDSCRNDRVGDHMNTEHVDVGPDYADTQVAEIFLHHRVLIIPVVDNGRVTGIITRGDFFRSIAERFLG